MSWIQRDFALSDPGIGGKDGSNTGSKHKSIRKHARFDESSRIEKRYSRKTSFFRQVNKRTVFFRERYDHFTI